MPMINKILWYHVEKPSPRKKPATMKEERCRFSSNSAILNTSCLTIISVAYIRNGVQANAAMLCTLT